MNWSPGRRIGRYVILDRVSQGPRACVFRARAEATGERLVVLKAVDPGYAARVPEFATQFQAEARALTGPGQSARASLIEVGEHEDGFYQVLDHVEGRTLRQTLARMAEFRHVFSAEFIAHVVEGLARSLSALHGAGNGARAPRHRAICAENAFLPFEGRPIWLGVGLPRPNPRDPADPSSAYYPPVPGDAAAADVFALGVLLHELLSGRAPGWHPSVERLPRVSELNPAIAPSLDEICWRATRGPELAPSERFASALELARRLEGYLSQAGFHRSYNPGDQARYSRSLFSEELEADLVSLRAVGERAGLDRATMTLSVAELEIRERTTGGVTRPRSPFADDGSRLSIDPRELGGAYEVVQLDLGADANADANSAPAPGRGERQTHGGWTRFDQAYAPKHRPRQRDANEEERSSVTVAREGSNPLAVLRAGAALANELDRKLQQAESLRSEAIAPAYAPPALPPEQEEPAHETPEEPDQRVETPSPAPVAIAAAPRATGLPTLPPRRARGAGMPARAPMASHYGGDSFGALEAPPLPSVPRGRGLLVAVGIAGVMAGVILGRGGSGLSGGSRAFPVQFVVTPAAATTEVRVDGVLVDPRSLTAELALDTMHEVEVISPGMRLERQRFVVGTHEVAGKRVRTLAIVLTPVAGGPGLGGGADRVPAGTRENSVFSAPGVQVEDRECDEACRASSRGFNEN